MFRRRRRARLAPPEHRLIVPPIRSGRAGTIALALAFATLAGIYYAWTASPILADFGGDNAIYLLSGARYSPFSEPSEVMEFFARDSRYPPLFPVALALLGGGESVLVAHLVTTSFLVLALVVLFSWLRRAGFGRVLAFAASAGFAMLPGTYLEALSVHSENLYLLFSLGCLAAAARAERRGQEGWIWGAVLLAAAASLTRGAGVALVAAVVAHLWIKRVPGRLALSGISVIPMLAWSVFGGQEREGYLQTFVSAYGGADLPEIATIFAGQARAFHLAWLQNFTGAGSGSGLGIAFVTLVGGLGLAGAVDRVRRRQLDGLYAIAYLGLVFLWPFPAETRRLVFVAVPVLLFQGLVLCARVPLRLALADVPVLPALVVALVGIQALPPLVLTATRFFDAPPPGLEAYRRHTAWYVLERDRAVAAVGLYAALVQGLRQARTRLPADACVYAIKPAIVGLYARRISVAPPEERIGDEAFRRALAARDCRYFYFMAIASPTYRRGLYPFERVRKEIAILDVVPMSAGRSSRVAAVLAERRLQAR